MAASTATSALPSAPAGLTTEEGQFLTSYDDFEQYPHNLLVKNCSKATLGRYTTKLSTTSDTWFAPEGKVYLPTCELNPTKTGWSGANILSEDRLQGLLGEVRTATGVPTSRTASHWKFQNQDSRCRFFFIGAATSRDPIQVTPRMLKRLFSFHQVMPNYLDFLSVFGKQDRPRHVRFSSFRDQDLVSANPPTSLNLPRLGRDGCQYQLCFNLKSVAFFNGEWTVRQAAAHHQFDFANGNSLWIFAQGHWDMRKEITAMLEPWSPGDHGLKFYSPAECFRSTFIIFRVFYEWSNKNWGDFLASVENSVEAQSKEAVSSIQRTWTIEDMIRIQRHEESANKITMHLESNTEILKALEQFFKDLNNNAHFPLKKDCQEDLTRFVRQLREVISDLMLQAKRAKLLASITSDRKTLILQRLQAQATTKAVTLSRSMFNFSYMAQKETIAMRVMAAVTIFYLPATFVSTFFSTDVIKYQNQPQFNNGNDTFNESYNGTFSNIAIKRWLAVSIPLTFITVVIGIWYYNRQKRNRESQIMDLEMQEKA